jgi:hypothetical protein
MSAKLFALVISHIGSHVFDQDWPPTILLLPMASYAAGITGMNHHGFNSLLSSLSHKTKKKIQSLRSIRKYLTCILRRSFCCIF